MRTLRAAWSFGTPECNRILTSSPLFVNSNLLTIDTTISKFSSFRSSLPAIAKS